MGEHFTGRICLLFSTYYTIEKGALVERGRKAERTERRRKKARHGIVYSPAKCNHLVHTVINGTSE